LSGFFVSAPHDFFHTHMDPFETHEINAAQIREICEAASKAAGLNIESSALSLGTEAMKWREIEVTARTIIGQAWGGGTDPSPFKILAATSIAIVALAPIPDYFGPSILESSRMPEICQFERAPAAYIAIDYSLSILHLCKIGENEKELSSPLSLSEHTWRDLMAALVLYAKEVKELCDCVRSGTEISRIPLTKVMFNTTALIFEMIAYKSNPEAQSQDQLVFCREKA